MSKEMSKLNVEQRKDDLLAVVSMLTAMFSLPYVLAGYLPLVDGILLNDAEYRALPFLVQILWFFPNMFFFALPIATSITLGIGTYKILSRVFKKEEKNGCKI